MIRKSCLLLCVLSLTAFTAAGCGDDKKDSSSNSTSTPAVTTDSGSTDSGSGDATGSTDAAVQAAIDQCKSSIDSNPAVKADIKPDLMKICEKAASGDAQAAKDAAKEVCLKIVESSGLPDAALSTAKSACDKAGQ